MQMIYLILCRSKGEIENAIDSAKRTLEKLHLDINKDKTEIDNFDHGFQYLGLLFNKSINEHFQDDFNPIQNNSNRIDKESNIPQHEIVNEDEECKTEKTEIVKDNINKEDLPIESMKLPQDALNKNWLMQIAPGEVKPLEQINRTYKTQINKISGTRSQRSKFPLYINGSVNSVRFEGDALVIKNTENIKEKERKIPFEEILSLVFMGTVKISFAAVVKLNLNHIPVYFTNLNGNLYLSIPYEPKNYKYWLRQQHLAEDEEFSLSFAKQVVTAKIHNSLTVLLKQNIADTIIKDQLNSLFENANKCESIDTLRGIEGRASAVYFEGYGKLIPAEWKFAGRVKHPPPDPVNCMLSISYMVLFNHIATALQIAGLNPDIGFYHISRGRYPALASDLVEEFRFIAESRILYFINRNWIKPIDFSFNSNGKYPCSMNKAAMIELIHRMEKRLDETFTPAGTEKPITYLNYFYLKANSILDILKNRESNYQPLMTR